VNDDVEDTLRWLPSIALFGGLEEPSLRRVVAMMAVHHFEPGQEVCRQDEAGRAMFLIRSGEVMVCRDSGQRRIKMVRMGPGDFFGEMTLIDVQKRSATVVVEQPALLLSLSNRDLYRLFQEDAPGYVMILQNLCRELSRRLRATNLRLQALAEEQDDDDRTLIRPAIRPKPL
jgi:CRP/FNR family transcriptional regulator, cyclic AMP receptor protein